MEAQAGDARATTIIRTAIIRWLNSLPRFADRMMAFLPRVERVVRICPHGPYRGARFLLWRWMLPLRKAVGNRSAKAWPKRRSPLGNVGENLAARGKGKPR